MLGLGLDTAHTLLGPLLPRCCLVVVVVAKVMVRGAMKSSQNIRRVGITALILCWLI
jgi:hypothetical protein